MSDKKSRAYMRGRADWSAGKYDDKRPGLFSEFVESQAVLDDAHQAAEEYREGWYDKQRESKK